MPAYSFQDVSASVVGPGGAFSIGAGSANSDEGITITPNGEKDVMTIGADGQVMHTLIADKSGKVEVKLLKVSPVNAKLMALYDAQSISSALWGSNVITVQNVNGDVTTCRSVAFAKKPVISYTKNGTEAMTWEFNAGLIDSVLGTY